MKKKIIALLLSMVLCFSTPAVLVSTALTIPDMGDLVSAVAKDTSNSANAFLPLTKLSVSLMQKMGPYLKNVVFTEDNIATAEALAEKLMAKVMTKIQTETESRITSFKEEISSLFSPKPETTTEAPAQTTEKPSESTTKPVTEPTTEPTTKPTTEPSTDEYDDTSFEITAESLSDYMKKYIFIKIDGSEDIAKIIAQNSNITYHTLEDDTGTLYISVNIEENPEIFNYAVFRQVVENLAERQDEEMIKDKNGNIDYVMTYEHIAGELALHMLLFAGISEVMHITNSKDKRLISLYKSASTADLNIDEARVPSEALSILGILLMDTIKFNTYKVLGLI